MADEVTRVTHRHAIHCPWLPLEHIGYRHNEPIRCYSICHLLDLQQKNATLSMSKGGRAPCNMSIA